MKISAVTLDCAQTLLHVDYDPARLAVASAEHLGLALDPESAAACYAALLAPRWPEYERVCRARDHDGARRFWETLARDWLRESGEDPGRVGDLIEAAEELLYGRDSPVFRVYDDVPPALERLRAAGLALAVVSNWDLSLERCLSAFGLREPFACVAASMVEGVAKPAPRLFRIALDALGVPPEASLHVGDDPIADVEGARRAGMRAVWLDRSRPGDPPGRFSDLQQFANWLLGDGGLGS